MQRDGIDAHSSFRRSHTDNRRGRDGDVVMEDAKRGARRCGDPPGKRIGWAERQFVRYARRDHDLHAEAVGPGQGRRDEGTYGDGSYAAVKAVSSGQRRKCRIPTR